jgi:hypothetical protein
MAYCLLPTAWMNFKFLNPMYKNLMANGLICKASISKLLPGSGIIYFVRMDQVSVISPMELYQLACV